MRVPRTKRVKKRITQTLLKYYYPFFLSITESYSLAKDEKVSDLQKPSQVCVSKKVKAELKSKGGEWTLDGEICATSVDEVTDIKVCVNFKSHLDLFKLWK